MGSVKGFFFSAEGCHFHFGQWICSSRRDLCLAGEVGGQYVPRDGTAVPFSTSLHAEVEGPEIRNRCPSRFILSCDSNAIIPRYANACSAWEIAKQNLRSYNSSFSMRFLLSGRFSQD